MKKLITLVFLLTTMSTAAQSDATSQVSAPVQKALPCDTPENRAFDFWIGSWRVTTPDGKHAGDSKIVSVEDGCVIRENWTSATSKYTGTSHNFYNKYTSKWEQVWLDNQGGWLHLRGEGEENKMILRTEDRKGEDGKISYNQITWTKNEDGTVRQFWQVFTEGQEPQVSFDGLYTASK